jgi:hypothetical protein
MKSVKRERQGGSEAAVFVGDGQQPMVTFPLETLAQYVTFPRRMFISLAHFPSLARSAPSRAFRTSLS